MSAGEPVIEVQGLVNRFGNQVVHQDLDLEVRRGEIIAIVGGSGSGKSVLLRSIIGLRRSDAGSVRLLGQAWEGLGARRRSQLEQRIGVLFQEGALFSSLTVAENVALPLVEHGGLPRLQAQQVARLKLALVGLGLDSARKAPSDLSGGMRKRVALARALALDAEILFLDEPSAGLDPIAAANLDRLIHTLRGALGLTVVMVTHDLDTLYAICDRVAVLSQKRILAIGPVDEVAAQPDPWVQAYFHGPRGRAAQAGRSRLAEEV
ncbi:MAG TPA: ATP-binding cassette domain-containing protein [Rhodanobacteraceae bacterium]|nr:ATP-binding cassette domain-containing protein [Rhodanobacteraceae bacterium]